ncbi:ECF transporter S component [Periweissella beninensis]|uniref:ECF transporter S component n=1 Tax=Periweissella beninensis TaxID=504936 RepID=A0ABT0VIV4_9LACO|nr:ECF transporter S component [Periweissella beninensis]MBM7543823.1 putative membrane protein [Periweissella beninensis]MCM2436794.1 ECF transporter S component [Periweissella beninensis]MCT4395498.1 ECF transporter S component [Periweissella beninensis]
MAITKIKKLVLTALFMAIILLQTQIPFLGYIPLGAVAVGVFATIIQFTIAIATIILGTKSGIIIGGFFGIISFIRAWSNPGSIGALIFQNPFTAIGARIMIAIIIGWFAKRYLINSPQNQLFFKLSLAGLLAAFVNTASVVMTTWLGFNVMHTTYNGIPNSNLFHWLLISVVGFNGIAEMLVGMIYVPLITQPLLKHIKNS